MGRKLGKMPRPPVDTAMALGKCACWPSQSMTKACRSQALPFLPLSAVGPARRTNHIDLMRRLDGHQEVGIHIAAVEHVGPGEEISIGYVLLDGGAYDAILRGRWRRAYLCDENRLIGITGFRKMHCIPHPMGLAFATVAGLRVIGDR
jgi:hypothetical protein